MLFVVVVSVVLDTAGDAHAGRGGVLVFGHLRALLPRLLVRDWKLFKWAVIFWSASSNESPLPSIVI